MTDVLGDKQKYIRQMQEAKRRILDADTMGEPWDSTGKTCLVTGGASGIGALNIECFLKGGAKKVAILDIADDEGKKLQQYLNKSYGDRVVFYKCDMSNEEQISKVFKQVVKDFQQVDIIVNNAGIFSDSPQMWRKASDVNWQGVVSLTLKGIEHMRKDKGGVGGSIINISSVAGLVKFPYLPIYNGSKAAILHFSQSLSVKPFYEETGIRILVMCYGATDTSLLSNIQDKAWDNVLGKGVVNMVAPALPVQKAQSAAEALYKMYREAPNGSIWLSINNNGGKDITSIVDTAYKTFENLLNS